MLYRNEMQFAIVFYSHCFPTPLLLLYLSLSPIFSLLVCPFSFSPTLLCLLLCIHPLFPSRFLYALFFAFICRYLAMLISSPFSFDLFLFLFHTVSFFLFLSISPSVSLGDSRMPCVTLVFQRRRVQLTNEPINLC